MGGRGACTLVRTTYSNCVFYTVNAGGCHGDDASQRFFGSRQFLSEKIANFNFVSFAILSSFSKFYKFFLVFLVYF